MTQALGDALMAIERQKFTTYDDDELLVSEVFRRWANTLIGVVLKNKPWLCTPPYCWFCTAKKKGLR